MQLYYVKYCSSADWSSYTQFDIKSYLLVSTWTCLEKFFKPHVTTPWFRYVRDTCICLCAYMDMHCICMTLCVTMSQCVSVHVSVCVCIQMDNFLIYTTRTYVPYLEWMNPKLLSQLTRLSVTLLQHTRTRTYTQLQIYIHTNTCTVYMYMSITCHLL